MRAFLRVNFHWNAEFLPVRLPVPGPDLCLEGFEARDAAFAETLAGDETEFDFGLIEPASVFGRVVKR